MKLFYRKHGQGQPIIILHGLFGQSDNWNTLSKQFAESGFEVYTVDLRNHGLSPHSEIWDYEVMSSDVEELINDLSLKNVVLVGHSMGGKVAMELGVRNPRWLSKLIVVDIAPKYYAPHHQDVLNALNAVDFSVVKTRKEAEAILTQYINDFGTKQFLLKNIYWKENGDLDWRFNLKVIDDTIDIVGKQIDENAKCEIPALFIRGGLSRYILDEDIDLIQQVFPLSRLVTIAEAGHWVHAEKPKEFFEVIIRFITHH